MNNVTKVNKQPMGVVAELRHFVTKMRMLKGGEF